LSRIHRIVLLCLLVGAAALSAATPAFATSALEVTPTQLAFAEAEVDAGSVPAQSLSFHNAGILATNVKDISISGADAADFKLSSDGCSGLQLEPTMSCEVLLAFAPTSAGAKSATLELLESNGSVAVPLSGAGVTGTLSAPASIELPLTITGQNQTRFFNVADAGAASHIFSTQIIGPDAASFSISSDGCSGTTFNPGNTCGIGVEFHPSSPGTKSAQLLIAGDAGNAPVAISLSGTGAQGPRLSIDSVQALLGDVLVDSSLAHTFTLTNTGDYPMGLQDFMVSGTPLMFVVLADNCSRHEIEPGASCSITVDFRPSTPGVKAASIILISESVGGITAIGLEGNGLLTSTAPATPTPPLPASALGPIAPGLNTTPLPRLIALGSYRVRKAINTHVIAVCPATVVSCQVHSTLARALAHRAASAAGVALGTSSFTLAGGHSTTVRTRLSHDGAALLEHQHSLRVLATVVISVPNGAVVRRHTHLTLRARGVGA
jgi:hypothetical protein